MIYDKLKDQYVVDNKEEHLKLINGKNKTKEQNDFAFNQY